MPKSSPQISTGCRPKFTPQPPGTGHVGAIPPECGLRSTNSLRRQRNDDHSGTLVGQCWEALRGQLGVEWGGGWGDYGVGNWRQICVGQFGG